MNVLHKMIAFLLTVIMCVELSKGFTVHAKNIDVDELPQIEQSEQMEDGTKDSHQVIEKSEQDKLEEQSEDMDIAMTSNARDKEVTEKEEISTEEDQTKDSNNEISPLSSSNDLVWGDYTYTIAGNNATITGYIGLNKNLIIPNQIESYTITSIASEAFSASNTIMSVTLPEGLQSIGYGAFSSPYLTSITIPKGLVNAYSYEPKVGGSTYAFSNCSQLGTVILEDGMTKVPDHLMQGVKSLKKRKYQKVYQK